MRVGVGSAGHRALPAAALRGEGSRRDWRCSARKPGLRPGATKCSGKAAPGATLVPTAQCCWGMVSVRGLGARAGPMGEGWTNGKGCCVAKDAGPKCRKGPATPMNRKTTFRFVCCVERRGRTRSLNKCSSFLGRSRS
jgi:hypothetical protein